MFRVLFIGTGSAEGAPVYGCDCDACRYARIDPVARRKPSSMLFFDDDYEAILVDAGTEAAARALDYMEARLHAILLTHWHHDHYAGLYLLRWMKHETPLYHPSERADKYLLANRHSLEPRTIRGWETIEIGPYTITPIPLSHGIETLGYIIRHNKGGTAAVLIDTHLLPRETLEKLLREQVNTAIIDATYPPNTQSNIHNNVDEAIDLGKKMAAQETILTHISHHNMPHNKLAEYAEKKEAKTAYDNMMHEIA